ncbi:histidine phosphatase family protein [Marinobacter metalliresistant]|uniref:Histidine phosphatase family protein n=1 Tax=Marinobacter metalliresistant TaxID=2961995 RepID=A0ABZ2W4S1_9GAMM
MIYFLRHGETDYNRHSLWMGRLDQPLNAAGVAQAQQTAERLAQMSLGQIITSPLSRAQDTATIIANRHPDNPPVKVADWLIERDYGRFEGLKKTPANRAAIENDLTTETMAELFTRLAPIRHIDETKSDTLIISHSGIYRCLVSSYGYTPDPDKSTLSNAEFVTITPPQLTQNQQNH